MNTLHTKDRLFEALDKLRAESVEAENRKLALQTAIRVIEERITSEEGTPLAEDAEDVESGPYSRMPLKPAILLVFEEAGAPLSNQEVRARLESGGWTSTARDPSHMVNRRIRQLYEAGRLARVAVGVYALQGA